MLYTRGQRVRVRTGLPVGMYDGIQFTLDMQALAGREFVIARAGGPYFSMIGNPYAWTDPMVEPATVPATTADLHVGDVIDFRGEACPVLGISHANPHHIIIRRATGGWDSDRSHEEEYGLSRGTPHCWALTALPGVYPIISRVLTPSSSSSAQTIEAYMLSVAQTHPEKLLGIPVKRGTTTVQTGTLLEFDHRPASTGDAACIVEWENHRVDIVRLLDITPVFLKIPKGWDPNKEKRLAIKKRLVASFLHAHGRRVTDISAKIATSERELGAYQMSLATYQEKVHLWEEKLKDLKKQQEKQVVPKGEKDFLAEIALIKRLKSVERVYISEQEEIVVVTKELHPAIIERGVEKSKRTSIGAYTIIITPHDTVRIFNRTFQCQRLGTSRWEHPHVTRDSNQICFGQNHTTLYELLGRKEYFAFVDFLLTFLTSWNVVGASPYIPYHHWEEGKVKTELPERGAPVPFISL